MGTYEQQAEQQERSQEERVNVEESNLMITGPPASRTVIDNLKKLLVQRQHSRESDTENKNAARSNSGSNSDAAFYSQLSTSSSDSDDSDDYMIFQEISNQAACNNGSNGTSNRRRHRRRRSYSSSSSSSPSPVARSRRKVTRVNVTFASNAGGDVPVESGVKPGTTGAETIQQDSQSPIGPPHPPPRHGSKEEHDSANSTSSHKDSSSDAEFPGNTQGNKSLSSSAEATGLVSAGRCPKLKSRRDRDRKRKRSELNYATHRPKIRKSRENANVTTSSHNEPSFSNSLVDIISTTGGGSDGVTSVPTITITASSPPSTSVAAATMNSGDEMIEAVAENSTNNASFSKLDQRN